MQSALELRARLRQLQRHYRVVPTPALLPLTEPQPYALIFEGTASTTDLDRDRMRLSPFAFGRTLPSSVPLLIRHNPTAVAGEIQGLHYSHNGTALHIRARVEHPEARRLSAFSVGLRILECELHDADNANFHGVLRRVELTEISLTDNPSNPRAVVERRTPAAISDTYTLMQRRVQCLAKCMQVVGTQLQA